MSNQEFDLNMDDWIGSTANNLTRHIQFAFVLYFELIKLVYISITCALDVLE
jgi:hypothetical protein